MNLINSVMRLPVIKKHLILFIFLVSLTSCTTIFENNYDVMARKALYDLIKAQETYHDKHGKYANKLAQLANYNLKYHTGIVYLEIRSASKNEYRAISLPAESSTARVFISDTSQGGYYEADEVEASKYVLGALNFIRSEKAKQKTNTLLISFLLFSLIILGLRFVSKYKGKENNHCLTSYFISLPALGWAIAILNHVNDNIVFSPKVLTLSWTAITASLVCIIITLLWLRNRNLQKTPSPVLGLAGCSLFISFISLTIVTYILAKFYPI